MLRAWLRPAGVRFSGRTDRMDKMARRFRKLARRRLVILGEAGAGKTTLAVLPPSHSCTPAGRCRGG
ncbi:hypothetical protein [Nonomuraea cavernae]|uniref:hypothetical protein n=1 Tax=Nonomuraea cavernae TaxID=2045107 RepID=UPI00340EE027